MSNYKVIELPKIEISHFISIENGSNYVSLSIHIGKEFKEAILEPEQAIEVATELVKRAKSIIDERRKKEAND